MSVTVVKTKMERRVREFAMLAPNKGPIAAALAKARLSMPSEWDSGDLLVAIAASIAGMKSAQRNPSSTLVAMSTTGLETKM